MEEGANERETRTHFSSFRSLVFSFRFVLPLNHTSHALISFPFHFNKTMRSLLSFFALSHLCLIKSEKERELSV